MANQLVAIACQGGGSQTAFTAGVLHSFFARKAHQKRKIVSLSGTSGGAVCAALAWYGLLESSRENATPIQDRLSSFWSELSAMFAAEASIDGMLAQWMRVIDKGMMPRFEISPASQVSQWWLEGLRSILPRPEFTDLKLLLEKHIDFGEIATLLEPTSPVLLIGAADVLTGELKVFNSRNKDISVDAIMASAAVPNLFPAVQIGDRFYWDGLFSDNPPLKELVRPKFVGGENVPDEVWVIQINPQRCKKVPVCPAEIIDRRNQMIGNLSLLQSIEFIELINLFLKQGVLTEKVLQDLGVARRDPIEIHFVTISEEVQDDLDYVSKLSREPKHIDRLYKDGEKQGAAFLDKLGI